MAFRYRLETLLRLQRSVEHQEENRLLVCVARVTKLQTEWHAWQEMRWQQKRAALADHVDGAPGILLRITAELEDAGRRREKALEDELKAAETASQKQLRIYRQARQKREILESLKERQESEYTIEQLRQMQKNLDEAHLLRTFSRNS